jgi:hypothetical protein
MWAHRIVFFCTKIKSTRISDTFATVLFSIYTGGSKIGFGYPREEERVTDKKIQNKSL